MRKTKSTNQEVLILIMLDFVKVTLKSTNKKKTILLKRMRILHIHPSMLAGGVEAMICATAAEMACQGHDVTFCSIYQPKPDDIFWDRLPETVHKVTLGKQSTGFL